MSELSPSQARTLRRGVGRCIVKCPCGHESIGDHFGNVTTRRRGDAWMAFRRHWLRAHGRYPFGPPVFKSEHS